MAISNATQFRLLLWKNWLLQKRRVVVTTLQILLPPLFAFIVLLLRMPVDSEFISTPKIWDSFDPLTLPPELTPTPTPPDLMEFNFSSFNVSTLPSNLPNQDFDSGSFEASTLPPNLTVPNQAGNMTWMLVFSPNTSHAATRIAQVVTRILDITPFPIGTVHHYIHTYITICIARCVDSTEYMSNQRRWRQSLADYLLMLLTIFFYLTCEVSFIFSEVTRVTRYQSVTPKIILRLDLVIRSE